MQDSESVRLWAVYRGEATDILDELASLVESFRDSAVPAAPEAVGVGLRLTHNLKGASASVGAERIARLAHRLEDKLASLRATPEAASEMARDLIHDVVQMQRALDDARPGGDAAEGESAAAGTGPRRVPRSTSPAVAEDGFTEGPSALRVESGRLDGLMGFAGQVLQTRAHLRQRTETLEQLQDRLMSQMDECPNLRSPMGWLLQGVDALIDSSRRDHRSFASLADDMNASLRSIRMIPLAVAAPGWRQAARDAGQRLGKQVEISIHVGDIEVDKRVLDNLYDPVNHLLRNAVDHGIEPGPEREGAGKPPSGRVRITGEALGSRLRLTVEDDGRGVQIPQIGEHAARTGLRTAAQLEEMSERQIADLLFHPGFSTRGEVSQVSGRGIGLDAVRRRLEQVGGRIDVDLAHDAAGARFTIHVPVSVMSIPGLLVRVSDELLAIPIDNVERTARVDASLVRRNEGTGVVSLGDSDPVRLRSLSALFGVPADHGRGQLTIVVASSGDSRVGLIVDDVIGHAEFVMRPLPWNVAQVPGVNGAVVLDDGTVALAIDVLALVNWAPDDSPGADSATARRAVVLVVDDSLSIRTLHKSILTAAGYDVVLASDGDEAWALLHKQPVDLVVSDVLMPAMDGIELTRRIRADTQLRGLPVILVTSIGADEDLERGVDAGANEYITKSTFDQSKFLRIVATYA